jgi:hypothetical protein
MIPEHANWLVDNMAVTELHLYGSTLGNYPNVLSVMVDVISEHKPNQIHVDKKKNIDMGENPIPTWLTIDVMDDPMGEDFEPLPLVDNGLEVLGIHTFQLKNVELKTDTGMTIKTKVKVEFVDCLADPDKEDDDFLRYHRGLRIVFYP